MTQVRRQLPVEAVGGSIYELLLTIWLAFDSGEEQNSFELGGDWFKALAESTDADLRSEIEFLGGGQCLTWCALRGLVAFAPGPYDIDTVLAWIETLDPAAVREALLAYECTLPDDARLVDRAVAGDVSALESVLADKPDSVEWYRQLFEMDEGELRNRLVDALRRWRTDVFAPFEADFAQATAEAARATQALAKGADPERVIEGVTNGLDYRIPPGVSRLVLVPSVVLRPWAVIDRYRDVLMVAFPVADEYIGTDPEAPPAWVVKLHKALGDEKRLRILRRLSESATTLDDLAEILDVTKSTVHHHVGLLRSAGLVRVVIDPVTGAKTYGPRSSVLPEARRALDEYLTAGFESQTTLRREA